MVILRIMHLYVKIFVFLLELIKRCLNFTLLLLFLSPKSEWHVRRRVCDEWYVGLTWWFDSLLVRTRKRTKEEMSLSQKHTHLSLINEKEWKFGKHFVCGTTYIQHHWELFQFNPTINPVTKANRSKQQICPTVLHQINTPETVCRIQ